MADEQIERLASQDDVVMERSTSKLIFDGMTATGVLSGGLGTAGLAAAKLKETFGSKDESSHQQQQQKKG